MFPNYNDLLARMEQYKDLLREAEHERLAQAIKKQRPNSRHSGWVSFRGLKELTAKKQKPDCVVPSGNLCCLPIVD